MEYNLKVYNYADNRKQIRIYSNTIEKDTKRTEEINEKRQNKKQMKKERGIDSDREWSATVSKNRTIQNIYHVCRANKFEWFITFTFDKKRVDRQNYDDCIWAASSWIKETNRRYKMDLKYILIPEFHDDHKSWHIHALFGELGSIELKEAINPKNGKFLKDKKGRQIYNLPSYFYGFSTATKIDDNFAAIAYSTKYITKSLCTEIRSRKRYITSHNLKRPEVEEHIINKYEKDNFIDSIKGKILNIQEKEFGDEKITFIEIEGDLEELNDYDLKIRNMEIAEWEI